MASAASISTSAFTEALIGVAISATVLGMKTIVSIMLVLYLGFFRNLSAGTAERLEQRRDRIVENLVASELSHGVPAGLMMVVAFNETHLGCDAREGGNWGAPISATRRHVAGTPLQAARVLARGGRHCGSWPGAVSFFRTGLCRPVEERHKPYVSRVVRQSSLVYGAMRRFMLMSF